jgi:putative endonuclease
LPASPSAIRLRLRYGVIGSSNRAVALEKRMPRRNEVKAGCMRYVYILQSEANPDRFYVGLATDLKRRLVEHNSGKSIHTNKYIPWKLVTYVAFSDAKKAEKFETYLKSGSGRSFAKRHF